jgi:galactokinase
MTTPDRLAAMTNAFAARFGPDEGLVLARAPGRVNLIGEHTDYNGGYVLPMAIERDIAVLGRITGDTRVRLYSLDFDQACEFDVDDHTFDKAHAWVNYPKGVIRFTREAGIDLRGFDAVIAGDVPVGGGLSSSAAFEVATAKFLLALSGAKLDGVALAKLARRAENEFVGVQCGIMDQFVSVFAEENKAVFIDCKSLEHHALPLFGDGFEFVIANSMVKHALGESAYHTRQAECREGLDTLMSILGPRETLRDVDEGDYRVNRDALRPVVRRRLDHVFSENRRVLEALEAMQATDAARFGQLMNASHDSLRDDYEVSCSELDALVEAARRTSGVLGSRMTGGGFGGCTVSLVHAHSADDFVDAVADAYKKETGYDAEFIRTKAAAGASVRTVP